MYFSGYSEVKDSKDRSGFCRRVNWNNTYLNPPRCYKDSYSNLGSCEEFCTALSSCVSYHYQDHPQNGKIHCNLITSDKDTKCPSGWNFKDKHNAIVQTANDLVAIPSTINRCYKKISGEK